MDVVHGLLRTVVRGFYDLRAIIILDAILTHHVLSDRELVTVTGIAIKDVRATCARLREDHLLTEVSHREENGPGMRAYTQTVYYIHFTEVVDAIKWKMHVVESKLKEELDHRHNAQDYICDVCGSHYETIDALTFFDQKSQQFLCGTCSNPLREEDANSQAADPSSQMESHMESFMSQLKPLLTALKHIDELSIPENNLESELQLQVPLIGVESQGPQSYNLPPHLVGKAGQNKPEEVAQGITIAGSADSRLPQQVLSTFQVNITSEAEQQAQRDSALAEKHKLAEDNQLPKWHAQSTISTDFAGSLVGAKRIGLESSIMKASLPTEDRGTEDAMDAYFKNLQAQQGNEEEEDEEDEDEFENIV